MNALTVGDLSFALQRSDKRKTLQITVERDGSLVMLAPPNVTKDSLRKFALEKRFWVYTKLAEKDRLHQRPLVKTFVDGEGLLYLGRSYRLRLVEDQDVPLKLQNGRFTLVRALKRAARDHLIRWYSVRAKAWLWEKAQDYVERMQVSPAGIRVQDLGYRWGSCGKGEYLYFHWKTILLPPRIAEYVVVHELAHLDEPHHTQRFWRRVERAMPDFELRKAWLAENGIHVEGI
jgi:predicted metal-dependent hydrolase